MAHEADIETVTQACRLAESGQDAEKGHQASKTLKAGQPSMLGGVLAKLRQSPLVDSGLDLSRERAAERKIHL